MRFDRPGESSPEKDKKNNSPSRDYSHLDLSSISIKPHKQRSIIVVDCYCCCCVVVVGVVDFKPTLHNNIQIIGDLG